MAHRKVSYASLVTISEEDFEVNNDVLFMKSLATLDPDLALIKRKLIDCRVNPALIPVYIEQLSKIDEHGWGKVVTEVREHRVVFCDGTVSRRLDLEISS